MSKPTRAYENKVLDAARPVILANRDATFVGYHKFRLDPCDWGENDEPIDYGSFEVFFHDKQCNQDGVWHEGYYWHACFPGCLPDGEAVGPFPTAEEAYNDARSQGPQDVD